MQNATPRTLFLESVRFIPAPQFEVFRFAEHGVPSPSEEAKDGEAKDDDEAESPNPSMVRLGTMEEISTGAVPDGSVTVGTHMTSLGPMAYLKEGDVEQYMFRLRGKLPPSQLKRTTALGRMEVRPPHGRGVAASASYRPACHAWPTRR